MKLLQTTRQHCRLVDAEPLHFASDVSKAVGKPNLENAPEKLSCEPNVAFISCAPASLACIQKGRPTEKPTLPEPNCANAAENALRSPRYGKSKP